RDYVVQHQSDGDGAEGSDEQEEGETFNASASVRSPGKSPSNTSAVDVAKSTGKSSAKAADSTPSRPKRRRLRGDESD
ncbi:MAG: hypothetical protein ACPIOQ_34990, partial [Promethearchaeia archaeon]